MKRAILFLALFLVGCAGPGQQAKMSQEELLQQQKTVELKQKIAQVQASLMQDPGNVSQLHELAKLYLLASDSDGCLKAVDQIKTLNKESSETHHYRATAHKFKGEHKEAAKYWELALQLNPNFAKASYNYGNLLYEQNKLKEAKAQWKKTLEIDPNYHKAFYNLGVLLHAQGNLKEAKDYYEKTLKREPNHANAHLNLGLVHCRLDNLDEGVRYFERAVAKNAKNYLAHLNLGLGKAKQGDLQAAIQSLEKAKALHEKDPWIHYNLAIAYDSVGETKKAIKYLEKAIELNPDFEQAKSEHRSLVRSLKGS